jgi:hypothetical protein
MNRMVGRLADRLVSLVVPGVNAFAVTETKCVRCGSSTRSKVCTRWCLGQAACLPWSCTTGCPC